MMSSSKRWALQKNLKIAAVLFFGKKTKHLTKNVYWQIWREYPNISIDETEMYCILHIHACFCCPCSCGNKKKDKTGSRVQRTKYIRKNGYWQIWREYPNISNDETEMHRILYIHVCFCRPQRAAATSEQLALATSTNNNCCGFIILAAASTTVVV